MKDRLAHDHAELANLLDELRDALEARDVERSHAALDLFWARLATHIRAEHLHLFPAILQEVSGSPKSELHGRPPLEAGRTIEALRRDHDFFMLQLSRAMVSMRGLLTMTDRQAAAERLKDIGARVAAVEARLASHNRVEENGVYLWTRRLLNEAEQTALAGRVQKDLEKMPPRFAANSSLANED